MMRWLLALVLLVPLAPSASAIDAFAGYSRLRLQEGHVNGGALALHWPWRGSLGLVTQATLHGGRVLGEDLRELALMAGPSLTLGRGRRLSACLQARAGLARERRQLEVFGVFIGPGGVCSGGCPSTTAFAAEVGGGLDLRLGARFSLRLAQVDYRLTRADGDADRRLRVSAGLVWRGGP